MRVPVTILLCTLALSPLIATYAETTRKADEAFDTEYVLELQGDLARIYSKLTESKREHRPGMTFATSAVVVQSVNEDVYLVSHTSFPENNSIVTLDAYVRKSDVKERRLPAEEQGYSIPDSDQFEVSAREKGQFVIALSNTKHLRLRKWTHSSTIGDLEPIQTPK